MAGHKRQKTHAIDAAGPTYEQKAEYSKGEHIGTVTTTVEPKQYSDYDCCRRLQVGIFAQPKGTKKPADAGYAVAWLVDKAIRSGNGRPTWLEELLEADDAAQNDQTSSLRKFVRALYRKDAGVRASMKDYQEALSSDTFVFIDTIKLNDASRGTGIAEVVMRSLSTIARRDLNIGLIVLEPARSGKAKWGSKTDEEVEQSLIGFYGRNEYKVWRQAKSANDVTVMALELTPATEVAKGKTHVADPDNDDAGEGSDGDESRRVTRSMGKRKRD